MSLIFEEMPHGVMPEKCSRSGSTLNAMPWKLTQRRRRTPIAPILPSLTSSIATRIEESFFLRKATSIGSSIPTTSLAPTIVAREWAKPARAATKATTAVKTTPKKADIKSADQICTVLVDVIVTIGIVSI